MKKTLLLLALVLCTGIIQAQKIKLSKGDVLLDGQKIMTYEREDWGMQKIHLFALGDGEEQILMIKNQNETPTYYDDDYLQIKFLPFGLEAEMKNVKSWKGVIAWLVKQKLFDEEGKLIKEKVELFVKNYDENITNRTIRHQVHLRQLSPIQDKKNNFKSLSPINKGIACDCVGISIEGGARN